MLEENTGVQKLYIAYGLGGIVVLWLAFGFGAQVCVSFMSCSCSSSSRSCSFRGIGWRLSLMSCSLLLPGS